MGVVSIFQASWFLAFFINTFLISIAQKLPLLTTAGWVHAGALGTILLGCLGWHGWFVVVIYLFLGSLVTRLGMARKKLEGLAEARGGKRGPENLWGSAGTGAILAICIKAGIGEQSLLLIGFATSFAAKLADTFGSEIGKRWGGKAYLITSFRRVPPGTDGAISLEGTLASTLGSLVMTMVMVASSLVPLGQESVLVFLIGLLSTLLESVLGAVAQGKFRWLTNEVVNFVQTSVAAILAITISNFLF